MGFNDDDTAYQLIHLASRGAAGARDNGLMIQAAGWRPAIHLFDIKGALIGFTVIRDS